MTLIFHFHFHHSRTTFQPHAFPPATILRFLLLCRQPSCFIRDLIWVHRICMQASMCACMICTYMGPACLTRLSTRHQPSKTIRGKGSNEPARRANIFHAGGTGTNFFFFSFLSSFTTVSLYFCLVLPFFLSSL